MLTSTIKAEPILGKECIVNQPKALIIPSQFEFVGDSRSLYFFAELITCDSNNEQ